MCFVVMHRCKAASLNQEENSYQSTISAVIAHIAQFFPTTFEVALLDDEVNIVVFGIKSVESSLVDKLERNIRAVLHQIVAGKKLYDNVSVMIRSDVQSLTTRTSTRMNLSELITSRILTSTYQKCLSTGHSSMCIRHRIFSRLISLTNSRGALHSTA